MRCDDRTELRLLPLVLSEMIFQVALPALYCTSADKSALLTMLESLAAGESERPRLFDMEL